ncbi:MAG: DegV family protein [Candidatus Izemoplasmatales bacterium]|uniref:DegV family protein n=1 Tax=Hujiaoplasma nucleasis TaxID=2725268 RepID=A0A7L6N2Y4_9MOLU|nr:DegV family protein [Hujiaoplasma nucleasis]QLY39578.1 DegV family protein [Hujiaoplasma nucleasis]
MKIGIAVDGNSGIDYLERDKEIRIFRSHLIIEKEEFEDFVEISSDVFYSRLNENPDLNISTAQTSTGNILEMYEEMHAKGYDQLLIITISKELSGTYQNAVLAAKMIDTNVIVYDSKSVSYVQAYMALQAQEMANQGKSIEEIIERLDYIRDHNHIYITVDTLKYLVKNGRLSNVAGAIGSLLKLKPLLEVNDEGKVKTVDKIRTTKKARKLLIERFVKETEGKDVMTFVVYTNNQLEMEDFKKELESHGVRDVQLVPLTPVVGTHAGPGTMGVGYIER